MIRLLIVDDHPVVRDGLRAMFAATPGFTVVGQAADGAEAVRMARRRPGPGPDGPADARDGRARAITALRARGRPVRVLVLTTYDNDAHVLPAIEAGATGYLLKDSPREELLRGARAAARGETVLSPSVAGRLATGSGRPPRSCSASANSRCCSWWRRPAPTGRRPPTCSSPRRRSRATCSTSTPSSASATARPPSPSRISAVCSADRRPDRSAEPTRRTEAPNRRAGTEPP